MVRKRVEVSLYNLHRIYLLCINAFGHAVSESEEVLLGYNRYRMKGEKGRFYLGEVTQPMKIKCYVIKDRVRECQGYLPTSFSSFFSS